MRQFTVLCAILFASASVAQIYQWKDENGRTVMSDTLPPGQARQATKIETEASSTATIRPSKSSAEQEADFRKRQRAAQEKAAKEEKEQAIAAERNEYCVTMRRQLQSLESGERIVRRSDQGERQFLDDTQREQEIAKIRLSVQNNCH